MIHRKPDDLARHCGATRVIGIEDLREEHAECDLSREDGGIKADSLGDQNISDARCPNAANSKGRES